MTIDYEADMAVFNSMPDTATRVEIQTAIEKARINRTERSRLTEIAKGWSKNFKFPHSWPRNWSAEDNFVVQATMEWLINEAYPEEKH